jgi:antitoxin Phd
MENIWQLQDAKNKFSNLVEKAHHEGPQFVTKHGKKSVVVLSVEEYQKIIKPQSNLVDFFQASPLAGSSLKIKRDKSFSREMEL